MTEPPRPDAPIDRVAGCSDESPAPSLPPPSAPAPATAPMPPPPSGPVVSSSGPGTPVGFAPHVAAATTGRRWPMRLLASSIGLVALLAMAGLASGSRGPVGGIGSTPDIDELVVSVGSTTPSPPAVDDPTDLASPICVELQQVRALSDEVSVIIGDALEEMTAPPGEMDEALVLARFRDAADLIDRSLPDLLDAYESAARMAPAEVAADLGAVEDGTALLAPTIVDTMRAVRSLDGLGAIDRALATPEMADAAVEAGQASLRLDGFTIPTCGFSFSNASP